MTPSINLNILSDFEKIIASILIKNELGDNFSLAYTLTKPSTFNSGYSFGYNQLDISERSSAKQLFLTLMCKAKDIKGRSIISKVLLKSIAKLSSKGTILGGPITLKGNPNAISTHKLELINQALSSELGIRLINASCFFEVRKAIAKVDKILNDKIDNEISRNFLKTSKPKAILIDYHNQFGMNENGKAVQYINGNEVHFQYSDGKIGKLKLQGNLDNLEKLRDYLYATKYGYEHKKDVERRQNNIDVIFALLDHK